MTKPVLGANGAARLTELAEILVPGTGTMPAARAIGEFESLLRTAADASGLAREAIGEALDTLPPVLNWETVRAFAAAHPVHFENLALLASGAYVMAPAVLGRLGFPDDRRNPAGAMEAAGEYETGILDPVIARGRCFRDPRSPPNDGS